MYDSISKDIFLESHHFKKAQSRQTSSVQHLYDQVSIVHYPPNHNPTPRHSTSERPHPSLPVESYAMCTTKHFKSRDCEHSWLELDTPAAKAKDSSTAPPFMAGHDLKQQQSRTSSTQAETIVHGMA
jgi:hypothetical protein